MGQLLGSAGQPGERLRSARFIGDVEDLRQAEAGGGAQPVAIERFAILENRSVEED